MAAGYSKTPTFAKLGIKPGMRVVVIDAPDNYADEVLGDLVERIDLLSELSPEIEGKVDLVHFYSKEAQALKTRFEALKRAISYTGALWISWPKAASKVKTDLSDNVVREIGLAGGLVDVKGCAVDT